MLSAHYKDGSSIDDQLIEDLIKSKNSANGHFNMRQILFAKMDQYFHTTQEKVLKKINFFFQLRKYFYLKFYFNSDLYGRYLQTIL